MQIREEVRKHRRWQWELSVRQQRQLYPSNQSTHHSIASQTWSQTQSHDPETCCSTQTTTTMQYFMYEICMKHQCSYTEQRNLPHRDNSDRLSDSLWSNYKQWWVSPSAAYCLLYPPSERSETGGYTVLTFVCLCVCICVHSVHGSSYRLKAIKLYKNVKKKFTWRMYALSERVLVICVILAP